MSQQLLLEIEPQLPNQVQNLESNVLTRLQVIKKGSRGSRRYEQRITVRLMCNRAHAEENSSWEKEKFEYSAPLFQSHISSTSHHYTSCKLYHLENRQNNLG